jgi:septum formation protein
VPDLILASTSPWRKQILVDAGLEVRAEPSHVDESKVSALDPVYLVEELAIRKAKAVANRFPDAWVIGADQVAHDVQRPSEIWGKPGDPVAHLEQLRRIRGRAHTLITGFAVVAPAFTETGSETTVMFGRADLEDAELQAYVDTEEGRFCAGGYAAEGRGGFLFERIDGDWFNVLGLPLFRILSVLRRHGWRFGDHNVGTR